MDRSKKKGVAIIASYGVLIALIIISAAFYFGAITETRNYERRRNSMRALQNAEEGVAYAIQELKNHGMVWWTHERDDANDVDGDGELNDIIPVRTPEV